MSANDDDVSGDIPEINLTQSKNKGVCYFPSIPPYMNPNHLRKMLA